MPPQDPTAAWRPQSLWEVAELTLRGASFDICLKNFLDGFYANPASEALAREPSRIGETFHEIGFIQDAYLAAVAEVVGHEQATETLAWAFAESRSLNRPWFALDLHLLARSCFGKVRPHSGSRNLFVSKMAVAV